jgi:hypothetical protein
LFGAGRRGVVPITVDRRSSDANWAKRGVGAPRIAAEEAVRLDGKGNALEGAPDAGKHCKADPSFLTVLRRVVTVRSSDTRV